MRGNQFDLNMSEYESFQSLLDRNAPILDLLQNKALNAQLIRGTLVLKDGSATLFALNVRALLGPKGAVAQFRCRSPPAL